jgi:FtsH-binding integral membrane protein
MSSGSNQLSQFDVSSDIDNLHRIIDGINEHRLWWKTALLIALGFIGLSFVFIWVIYATNENKTQEFNALIYSSAIILIVVLIVLSLMFFVRNAKEAFDFGGRLEGYVNSMKNEMFKQKLLSSQRLEEQSRKTSKAMKATEILADRSRQSALGEADKYVF